MRKGIALLALMSATSCAIAQAAAPLEIHAQATYLRQFKGRVGSPYEGPNSLRSGRESSYTFTSTLYLGARLGAATELYFNPEFLRGVPISELHGLGGFTNGEVQRGVSPDLTGYRARLFLRHAWNIGGDWQDEASDQNQVKTRYAAERIVLTAGNISVLDVFDAVDYSRDARTQFMNWASLTYGAWDYPADARGYTWGAAIEYISAGWQARAGRFLVPVESNGLRLERRLTRHYGDAAEFEFPLLLAGRPAIARALAFRNRVQAGAYRAALALGAATALPADVGLVRRTQAKTGVGVGIQMQVTADLGAYARAGWNDGRTETFMFTEIDRSFAAGIQARGGAWARPQDSAGVALYLNGLSRAHRDYLAAGGLGFFLGDGALNYGRERVFEAYYAFGVARGTTVSAGMQRIVNPGYNRDRGPANVVGLRVHTEI